MERRRGTYKSKAARLIEGPQNGNLLCEWALSAFPSVNQPIGMIGQVRGIDVRANPVRLTPLLMADPLEGMNEFAVTLL
ncbi:hypothetical protein CDAR_433201 [Caerostris darwini]|uniref:Uncharacterized protein n=1 Tax=Caerostris darwini TaxID=1538125 RepID=A0AAV4QHK1_9ARAC|nr:hypothetical protein CDAR_433201 [Caerostris darwini]